MDDWKIEANNCRGSAQEMAVEIMIAKRLEERRGGLCLGSMTAVGPQNGDTTTALFETFRGLFICLRA